MKMRYWVGLGLLLCAVAAVAANRAAVRKQAEMSMLVTGTVDIDRDGRVSAHALDGRERLPAGVVRLIDKAVPEWVFEPIVLDGRAVEARTRMHVRVVARRRQDGNYLLGVRSAHFGKAGQADDQSIRSLSMAPPHYPQAAASANVSGTVYLVLKVGRNGTVEDVVDEQTNLTVVGTAQEMVQARKWLANAAKVAARKWTFAPPTRGGYADQPYWSVRVPVAFELHDGYVAPADVEPEYGTWQAYIPGPRVTAPWLEDGQERQGVDALAGGDVHLVGDGPKLLTPLGEDAG